ncbi:MAG: hypothetical protein ACLP1X_04145 [Polyangiaceae bacterium]
MTGRSDPWWAAAFAALRPDIERSLGRRLSPESVQDVMSTVLEQLVEKSKAFSTTRPAWVSTTDEPSPAEVAEFTGLAWTMARMRMLDELRHFYVTRKAHARVRSSDPGVDVGAQLDARHMLTALAGYIDQLSVEDRHLLLAAVDGDCTDNGVLSPAQRVRLHRLRRQLAERLWQEMNPSETEGKDRG